MRINLKPLNHVKLQEIDSSMNLLNALIAPDFHQLYLQQLRVNILTYSKFYFFTKQSNDNIYFYSKLMMTLPYFSTTHTEETLLTYYGSRKL